MARMSRPLVLALPLLVLSVPSTFAGDDLGGPHECALWNDYFPCTLTPKSDGGYTIKQTGKQTFEGTLTPKGAGFVLDGMYKFPPGEGKDTHMSGDVERHPGGIGGRFKIDGIPTTVDIRAAKPAAAKSGPEPELKGVLAKLTTREAVTAGSKLPLAVRFSDAPKLSFKVNEIDEKIWNDKLHGIFGMVPAVHNIGIECSDKKLRCILTAESSQQVTFHFVRTPAGLKLATVELPAEGE
jgi:hypothetical protein